MAISYPSGKSSSKSSWFGVQCTHLGFLYPEKPLLDGFSHRWGASIESPRPQRFVRKWGTPFACWQHGKVMIILSNWGYLFFWPYRHLGTTTKCNLRQQLTSRWVNRTPIWFPTRADQTLVGLRWTRWMPKATWRRIPKEDRYASKKGSWRRCTVGIFHLTVGYCTTHSIYLYTCM